MAKKSANPIIAKHKAKAAAKPKLCETAKKHASKPVKKVGK